MRLALPLCLTLAALPLHAQTCGIDAAAMEARLTGLEQSYGQILSDIGCDVNTNPARQILCASAEDPTNDTLWRMERLAMLSWVYAVENATGQEADRENPPRDAAHIAARDACTDQACLCEVLIRSANDALGGTSPYPQ
jgi:hypothetical protein